MTETASPRKSRRIIWWVIGGVLLLLIAMAAWVVVRGFLAYGHLQTVQSQAAEVRSDLSDPVAASGAIDDIAAETAAAHALTSDPIWNLAETLPVVGPQLAAVGTVAEAADQVTSTALAPLSAVATSFEDDGLIEEDGSINLALFEDLEDAANAGADGVTEAAASIDSIDRAPLLESVRSAVDEVDEVFTEASIATNALARATVLLPAMLGADEPHDYMVLFQNNAEWRSLGGNPGAIARLHAEDGRIGLTAQESSGDYPKYPEPVLPLGDEITAIYGDLPGLYIQNITQVPDFTVTGALAQAMWAQEHDDEIDGVIAIDPVALSYLLEATGPVELESGDTLTSENAVDLLLNDIYLRYEDPKMQDAYFADAAAAVFEALSSGDIDSAKLLSALSRAGTEDRLLLWSAIEAEQELLAETTLAGELPVTDDDASRFGVFVNDSTASKMDYYLDTDTSVTWDSCELDPSGTATGTATLTVTITNNAPADAATLPDYITGGGKRGVPPGTAETLGYIYLPEGFELLDSSLSTGDTFAGGDHEGRRVLSYSVETAPGESATATVTVRAAQPASARLLVQQTPTLEPPAVEPAICE